VLVSAAPHRTVNPVPVATVFIAGGVEIVPLAVLRLMTTSDVAVSFVFDTVIVPPPVHVNVPFLAATDVPAVVEVTSHVVPRSRSVRVTLPPLGTTRGEVRPPRFMFPPLANVNPLGAYTVRVFPGLTAGAVII
jgi:hypothetical protein